MSCGLFWGESIKVSGSLRYRTLSWALYYEAELLFVWFLGQSTSPMILINLFRVARIRRHHSSKLVILRAVHLGGYPRPC